MKKSQNVRTKSAHTPKKYPGAITYLTTISSTWSSMISWNM